MNDKIIIFVPQFVDRSGRTVYNIYRRKPGRYIMPGELVGQARMVVGDRERIEFEWLVDVAGEG